MSRLRPFAALASGAFALVALAGCSSQAKEPATTVDTTTTTAHDMGGMKPGDTMPPTTHDMTGMKPGATMPPGK